jgi:hypothetical protein
MSPQQIHNALPDCFNAAAEVQAVKVRLLNRLAHAPALKALVEEQRWLSDE